MRPAFGAGDGMDLVHDDGAHRGQDAPRLGGEDQIQRFGRGDQDVRRVRGDGPPLLRRGVAAARGYADRRRVETHGLALGGDARQRRFQIARHIHAQRLQRRDIQHLDALGGFAGAGAARLPRLRRTVHQPVDGVQERGERLAGTGRRDDQRVIPFRDNRPGLALRRCLPLRERMPEPCPGGLGEQIQTFVHMFDYGNVPGRIRPPGTPSASATDRQGIPGHVSLGQTPTRAARLRPTDRRYHATGAPGAAPAARAARTAPDRRPADRSRDSSGWRPTT